jgi:hypothetical protein
VSSNTESVFLACGRQLWDFVVAHTVLLLMLTIFSIVFKYLDDNNKYKMLRIALIFSLLYNLAMMIMAFVFAGEAIGNAKCTAALSAVSSTKSPLLAQLTYVYAVYDILFIVMSIGLLVGVWNET